MKYEVFSILPHPGFPGDPKVGPHTDCVASWDTVGGIKALGGPQGPPQTGFGVAQDGPVEVLAVLQGKFGWKTVKIFPSWILPDPGCPGEPTVGPHSDCVVSWDAVGGIQALGCAQGPPQTGFGSHKMVPWRFWQFCKASRCLVP